MQRCLKLLVTVGSLFLASCGSGGMGGNALQFSTVLVTPSLTTPIVESDVASHSAPDTCGSSEDIIGTPAADNATIRIAVSALTGGTSTPGITPMDVQVTSIDVSFTPIEVNGVTGPTLDPITLPSGQTFSVGSGVLSVVVGSQENKNIMPGLICRSTIYTYDATVKVTVQEVMVGGEPKTFTVTPRVKFADFAQSGS